MAKQKELEVERTDVAWGGSRDERQREKLCLGSGSDGAGKQNRSKCLENTEDTLNED